MKDWETALDTMKTPEARAERLRRFQEADDLDQEQILALLDIYRDDRPRYYAILELVRSERLTRAAKDYLLGLVADEVVELVELSLQESTILDIKRRLAANPMERWKKASPARE